MEKKLFIIGKTNTKRNEEEDYSPVSEEKSPLFSYKLDKYHQFYHPISVQPLLKLHETSANSSEIFQDFDSFLIKDVPLSPSPQLKASNPAKQRLKVSKSFCFGLIKLQMSKELRECAVFSKSFSVIATTFHGSKHCELKDTADSLRKCVKKVQRFPLCEDLSVNVETFAELQEPATSAICSVFSLRKLQKVKDLRLVSFPAEKLLWHGPAFLFNSVMGFNKPEPVAEIPQRLELWHRFRGCFEQGALQSECLRLLDAASSAYDCEKLEVLHVILASYQRIGDKLLETLRRTLKSFLKELQELKILLSSEFLTDEGVCGGPLAEIKAAEPQKLKSFHFFLDVRTNQRVSAKTLLNLCRTLLGLSQTCALQYLSLGFLSNFLQAGELCCVAETLRRISKSLRSLVLVFLGNFCDEDIEKLAESFADAPNLKRICLGFMSSSLKNPEKGLGFLAEKLAEKHKRGALRVFHVYYNNRKGGSRNEKLEELLRNKICASGLGLGEEIDVETYFFC